jgi:hypothetical protein
MTAERVGGAELRAELRELIEVEEHEAEQLRARAAKRSAKAKTARRKLAALDEHPEAATRCSGAELLGPVKRLQGAKATEVESIRVSELVDFPGVLSVTLWLGDGRLVELKLPAADAYKLERRLAWQLDDLEACHPRTQRRAL